MAKSKTSRKEPSKTRKNKAGSARVAKPKKRQIQRTMAKKKPAARSASKSSSKGTSGTTRRATKPVKAPKAVTKQTKSSKQSKPAKTAKPSKPARVVAKSSKPARSVTKASKPARTSADGEEHAPIPEVLTTVNKILLSALQLDDGRPSFTAEDLIVRAWHLFPESFGLAGYRELYPDSNRVLAKLMGSVGMCSRGWLDQVNTKTYRMTVSGRKLATSLLPLAEAVAARMAAARPVPVLPAPPAAGVPATLPVPGVVATPVVATAPVVAAAPVEPPRPAYVPAVAQAPAPPRTPVPSAPPPKTPVPAAPAVNRTSATLASPMNRTPVPSAPLNRPPVVLPPAARTPALAQPPQPRMAPAPTMPMRSVPTAPRPMMGIPSAGRPISPPTHPSAPRPAVPAARPTLGDSPRKPETAARPAAGTPSAPSPRPGMRGAESGRTDPFAAKPRASTERPPTEPSREPRPSAPGERPRLDPSRAGSTPEAQKVLPPLGADVPTFPQTALLQRLYSSLAFQKFNRGNPITFADACLLWTASPSDPAHFVSRLAETEQVLAQAEKFIMSSGRPIRVNDKTELGLSQIMALGGLHKMLTQRFQREVDSVRGRVSDSSK